MELSFLIEVGILKITKTCCFCGLYWIRTSDSRFRNARDSHFTSHRLKYTWNKCSIDTLNVYSKYF